MTDTTHRAEASLPATLLGHLWDLLLFLWIESVSIIVFASIFTLMALMIDSTDFPTYESAMFFIISFLFSAVPFGVFLWFLGPYLMRDGRLRKMRHSIGAVMTLRGGV